MLQIRSLPRPVPPEHWITAWAVPFSIIPFLGISHLPHHFLREAYCHQILSEWLHTPCSFLALLFLTLFRLRTPHFLCFGLVLVVCSSSLAC